MGLVVHLVMGLVFWGYVALAIVLDQRLRTARARARGEVNFDDGRPGPYIFWGLLTGGLVLPVYFYASRKRAWALLLGAVVLAAVYAATVLTVGMTATAIAMLAR
jgi:hypothetical protein